MSPPRIAHAPCAPLLPEWPAAWYLFCASRELRHRPLGRRAFGRDLVAFRGAAGVPGVMLARCAHLGADLAAGEVINGCLRCPFHHWHFGTDGQCHHIPATNAIPDFARQVAFPTVEAHGGVFVFNAAAPAYDLPFFPGHAPSDLATAPPFVLTLDCPWYMIGANGIDVQHFRTTHDRELIGEPTIDHPESHLHHSICRFRVAGDGWRDRLTRTVAGPEVEMDVTDFAGTLFFVMAKFRRTRTFGMVSMLPLEAGRTRLSVSVSVLKSHGVIARAMLDPIAARVRRYFIRKFLEPDIARSAGTRYDPHRLIAADRCLADYFAWLHRLHPAAIPNVSSAVDAADRPTH